MAEIFMDGFDKYGTPGSATLSSLIVGEWTISSNGVAIVAPLSSTGQAISIGNDTISKTLPGNFARLIGGVRFKSGLGGSAGNVAGMLTFGDSATPQASIAIASGTGFIQLFRYTGNTGHLADSTSAISIKSNSVHYLEWDITFGAAGAYFVYLDGILVLSGNAITNGGTGNNQANQYQLSGGSGGCVFDDTYLFDTTGAYNNAVLLTNPRIETQLPIGDVQTQFTNSGVFLGNIIAVGGDQGGADRVNHNTVSLKKHTPPVNMTINSFITPVQSTPIDHWQAVLYNDNAGVPGNLLAQSASTQGTTDSSLVLPFLTPHSLTAGTPYWLGVMYKTNIIVNTSQYAGLPVGDNSLSGVNFPRAYDSGPADPAGNVSIGYGSFLFYGSCSNVSVNWVSENRNPPPGDLSSIQSNTPGNEDLYNFPPITSHPSSIYTVSVKSHAKLTDTGNRAVDLRMKSGGVTNSGTYGSQVLSTSYEWIDSFFTLDPNTSNVWTEATLNAAVSGIKVVT